MSDQQKKHLAYGEGQREQYGEGESYRPEEKTKAADESGKNPGFAAGGSAHEKGATSRKMVDAKSPDQNDRPISPQESRDPKGTGHEAAEGGLPEKQPSTKRQ